MFFFLFPLFYNLRRTLFRRTSPPQDPPSAGPPSAGPSALFFPSLLVEFWWCLKRRDPQMCTFGALGLSCETPAAGAVDQVSSGPRFESTSRTGHPLAGVRKVPRSCLQELDVVGSSGGLSCETPRERRKKENCGGRGKNKSEMLRPPPSGPHPSSDHAAAPHISGPHSSGPHPSGPPPFGWRPSGPHFFFVWAPTFLIFYHVAHLFFFCAFLIVSISCHFLFFPEIFIDFVGIQKRTFFNFFYIFFIFFIFFSWEGGQPKPKLVSSLGGRGYHQTSN